MASSIWVAQHGSLTIAPANAFVLVRLSSNAFGFFVLHPRPFTFYGLFLHSWTIKAFFDLLSSELGLKGPFLTFWTKIKGLF